MSNHDCMPVRRALISVSNKTGIIELARRLMQMQVEILSRRHRGSAARSWRAGRGGL